MEIKIQYINIQVTGKGAFTGKCIVLNECIKNEEIYKFSDPRILHKNLKKDQ